MNTHTQSVAAVRARRKAGLSSDVAAPSALAEFRRAGGLQEDSAWAAGLVHKFPLSWQSRIIGKWERENEKDRTAGNLGLLGRIAKLSDGARGGIAADATDADICDVADQTARDFSRRLLRVETIAKAENLSDAAIVRLKAFYCRALLEARGLLDLWPGPKDKKLTRAGRVQRMECGLWWRRTFRTLHARTVETVAIDIGLVSRSAGLYASDDRVKARAGQRARNAAILDSIVCINEYGQEHKLAELAAKGTANKTIRRQELLTRIAGFELIARESGHIGYMVTVTCPSRFHKCATGLGGWVIDNKKYDGSTPREAQAYLSKQWGKCRAAAARAGLHWYGFRIAEPQHDATPHWHCLLFMPHVADGIDSQILLKALVRRYFLDNESPTEAGAQRHRVDFEMIDWNKGSAVGYVIKYISKNIDGYGVGQDLYGNDAVTSSQRVDAWASTWRIRQFQQIGGAPVGVWRELRRLHPSQLQDDAPDALKAALSAINIGKIEPGIQSLAWSKYNKAQGGVHVARADLRIKLHTEQTGECGRYGEAMGKKTMGIVAQGIQLFKNHIHVMSPDTPQFERRAMWTVESERARWVSAVGRAAAVRTAEFVFTSGNAAPWIHVNNCTQPDPAKVSSFAPVHEFKPKKRQFYDWTTATGTDSPDFEEIENEISSSASSKSDR